jgi:hypothetical protein
VETVGGLLAQRLGRVPIAGSVATVAGLRLTAESLAGRRNRIAAVTVERIAQAGDGHDAESAGDGRGVAGNGRGTGGEGRGTTGEDRAGAGGTLGAGLDSAG